MGRSRGGLTTKLHAVGDGRGDPIRFGLTGGETADISSAETMLEGLEAMRFIADKGYDSDALTAWIQAKDAECVIPPRKNRKNPRPYDRQAYRSRNLIERLFNKLKQFRRIATRYDKTAVSFLGFVHLAAALLWLR